MIKIGDLELKPFVMTWKQYKDLRRCLGEVAGREEKRIEKAVEVKDSEEYAKALGQMVLSSVKMQEALLIWAYKLTLDDLDRSMPADIPNAVLEFLEINKDEGAAEASKKANVLLQNLYQ